MSNWYISPDWWSAIGQWIGAIGTLIAVLIALRQINETKKLQLNLLKPEVILVGKPTSDVPNKELTITMTNIKQTPIYIKRVEINEYYPKISPTSMPIFKYLVHNLLRLIPLETRFQLLNKKRTKGGNHAVFLKTGEYEDFNLQVPNFYKGLLKEKRIFSAEFNFIDATETKHKMYLFVLLNEQNCIEKTLSTNKREIMSLYFTNYFKLFSIKLFIHAKT
jgi:hypothetical protein